MMGDNYLLLKRLVKSMIKMELLFLLALVIPFLREREDRTALPI